jgi:hypothetical protein
MTISAGNHRFPADHCVGLIRGLAEVIGRVQANAVDCRISQSIYCTRNDSSRCRGPARQGRSGCSAYGRPRPSRAATRHWATQAE